MHETGLQQKHSEWERDKSRDRIKKGCLWKPRASFLSCWISNMMVHGIWMGHEARMVNNHKGSLVGALKVLCYDFY